MRPSSSAPATELLEVSVVSTRKSGRRYAATRKSPWIVPLDGGDPAEIVQRHVYAFDVSPDGRWLALLASRNPQSAPAQRTIVVCELPRCTNSRELAVPTNFLGFLRWTPDGKELAFVSYRLKR